MSHSLTPFPLRYSYDDFFMHEPAALWDWPYCTKTRECRLSPLQKWREQRHYRKEKKKKRKKNKTLKTNILQPWKGIEIYRHYKKQETKLTCYRKRQDCWHCTNKRPATGGDKTGDSVQKRNLLQEETRLAALYRKGWETRLMALYRKGWETRLMALYRKG